MRPQVIDRVRAEDDLSHAIDNDELRVVYQPLVSLRDRKVVGIESLVRWEHPAWGLVAPARFLPHAETSGLITRIGGWVLREACRQAAAWSSAHPDRHVPAMTVNVSTRQLAEPGFTAAVIDALDGAGLAPRRLVLDVTERAFHEDPSVVEVLYELKALGVRLYLDDFVSGSASLSWLTRFPLDGLKLEAPVVQRLGVDPKVRCLLSAVCGMAAAFDLDVVAEGVEHEDQAAILAELGCSVAQGYLFSRPVPPDRLDALLAAGLPRRPAVVAPHEPDASARDTVTTREAAQALGVSASTLRRWGDTGRLTVIRTTGGHRRYAAEDVHRLRGSLRPRAPRVRAIQPPQDSLPRTGELVRSSGATIVGAGLKATYEPDAAGWFAEAEGRRHIDRWLGTLTEALICGRYAPAIEATGSLTRRARLGGATTVECAAFLERSCAALLRLLSETQPGRDELPGARRVCAALRHHALAGMS
jgi:excisionase family DNA binding protein